MDFKPTLLLILDGFGLAAPGPGNAIHLADTPNLDRLLRLSDGATLAASGREVGLPAGYIGNSEVGHLNIGAGRVVFQDMTRIDVNIENGSFFNNPALLDLCANVRAKGSRLHFLGLLSDAGVHSHIQHLRALLQMAQDQKAPALVHAFMDGRDTSPTSGAGYIRELREILAGTGGQLATMCGRFWAMDRDNRWERVEQAWNLLVHGHGQPECDPIAALEKAYATNETDEFIKPRLLLPPDEATIKAGDGVFFFNFRADRARQMVQAFIADDFASFERGKRPELVGLATMTAYDDAFNQPVAFAKDNLPQTLGETLSGLGLKQLRIAETEKYAHVTYFFNGGREEPFPGEDRILVPSPKEVATYDLKPQMSAEEVTEKLLAAWADKKYQFVVCNLANPDMVGHTGVLEAAVRAVEVVDACVGRIENAVMHCNGRLCLTSDHGNAEEMQDQAGKPQTAHTTNRTPLIIKEADRTVRLADGGKLGDIAPTLLALWGVAQPAEMTGNSLLKQ